MFTRDLGLPHLSVPYGQPDDPETAPTSGSRWTASGGASGRARLLHAVAGVEPDGGD